MENKILILPDKIIEGIQVAFKKRKKGIPCSNGELSSDLDTFIDEQKALTKEPLYNQFEKGKKLSHRTIGRAMNKDKQIHQWGAREKLRNLLCLYAYRKSWVDTLKKIGTTEKEVEKVTKRIKGIKQKTKEDEINDHLGDLKMDTSLLKNSQQVFLEQMLFLKVVAGSIPYNKDVYSSVSADAEKFEIDKIVDTLKNSMQESEIVLDKLINSFLVKGMLLIPYCNGPDEVIILVEKLLSYNSNFIPGHFFKSISLLKKNDFEGALNSINNVISRNPKFGHALLIKAQIFYTQNKFKEVVEICDNIIDLIKNRTIHTFEKSISKYLRDEKIDTKPPKDLCGLSEIRDEKYRLHENALHLKIDSLTSLSMRKEAIKAGKEAEKLLEDFEKRIKRRGHLVNLLCSPEKLEKFTKNWKLPSPEVMSRAIRFFLKENLDSPDSLFL